MRFQTIEWLTSEERKPNGHLILAKTKIEGPLLLEFDKEGGVYRVSVDAQRVKLDEIVEWALIE